MKKLRLLLLGLLTPLLFSGVFAFDLSSDEITYLNNNALNQWSFSSVTDYALYNYGNNNHDPMNYCVIFSWLSFSWNPYYSIVGANSMWLVDNANVQVWYSLPYFIYCWHVQYSIYVKIAWTRQASTTYISVDKFWYLDASKITNWNLWFYVQHLLDNYNQCQTDLNFCDTITSQCLEDKNILSWQLATCTEDKTSLQNYNETLTTELTHDHWLFKHSFNSVVKVSL